MQRVLKAKNKAFPYDLTLPIAACDLVSVLAPFNKYGKKEGVDYIVLPDEKDPDKLTFIVWTRGANMLPNPSTEGVTGGEKIVARKT